MKTQRGEESPWMEDYSDQCAWLPASVAWLLLKAMLVCALGVAIACLVFMGGCQASGEGKGGASLMEYREEKPTTTERTFKVFGRNPTPEEWAVLQNFGRPEKKR